MSNRRSSVSPALLLSVALFVALLGAIWWGMGERDAKQDAEAEADRLAAQLAEPQSQPTVDAVSYRLTATPNGPANASGTAFMPLSGSGVLSVVNLPAPEAGMAWQMWYFRDDAQPPVAGATFTVNEDGMGYSPIPADVGSFRGIGVSLEPEGGSASPTTAMVLQGSSGKARG